MTTHRVITDFEYDFDNFDGIFDNIKDISIYFINSLLQDGKTRTLNNMMEDGQGFKFNDAFYNKIDGSLSFKNVYTSKQKKHNAVIKYKMNNIETEILIYLLINKSQSIDQTKVPARILTPFNNFKDLPFFDIFYEAFEKQIKFLDSEKKTKKEIITVETKVKTGKRGRPKTIKQEEEREILVGYIPQGFKRVIKPNTNLYKKYYGDIKLYDPKPQDLSNFDIINNDYDHCVLGWIKENLNKRDYNLYKDNIEWTYNDLLNLAMKHNFSLQLKDRTGGIIEEYDHDNTKKNNIKKLNAIICNGHLYIEKKNKKEPMIDIIVHGKHIITNEQDYNLLDETELENTTSVQFKYYIGDTEINKKDIINLIESSINKNIIIDNSLFEYIKNTLTTNKILNDYNDKTFKYKTNNIIVLNDYLLDQKKILIDAEKEKIKSFNNYINSICKLRGYLNNDTYKLFEDIQKIRYYKTQSKFNIQYDANKSYPSKLLNKNYVFGVPSISDEFINYDNSPIEDFYWYEIELNNYDLILAPQNGIYCGYAVRILKNENRLNKIIKVLKISNYMQINPEDIKHINIFYLTIYIGWLRNTENIDIKYYDNLTDNNEINALLNKYGEEAEYSEKDKQLIITKQYKKLSSGIIANSQIIELNNIELYKLKNEFMKLNPNSYITHLKTDAIGFLSADNIKHPSMVKGEDAIGFFKIEKDFSNNKYQYSPIVPTFTNNYSFIKDNNNNVNMLNEINYKDIIDKKLSFGLFGAGGYGKTYYIKNSIIPYLEKINKKYILASTTIENASDIKGITIQSLFHNKTEFEIKNIFDGITYLIIDESSQLTQQLYKRLEQLKEYNVKFILIGDECQTHSVDSSTSLLRSNFTYKLLDYNVMLKEHNKKYCRYDEELNKHLQFIRNNFNNIDLIKNYVYKNFQITNEKNTAINIAYFHKTCDNNENCHTVHSYQGKTINEPFTIYNIYQMSSYLIYTALSRATKYNNIFIFKQ